MILILSFFIIALDQITKFAAVKYLKGSKPYIIIPNFFELNYVENFGAAFGILQEKRVFFIVITLIVILSITFYLIKNYYDLNTYIRLALAMLIGGAIGNFIDRFRVGYVVDFLSFKLFKSYDFPVFNIADIFIVIGTILLSILILFDKHEA